MSIVDKLRDKAIGAVVGKPLRNAAVGKYGPKWQKLYWSTAGIKTTTGVVLATAAAAIVAAQNQGLCDLAVQSWAWVDCAGWLEQVKWVTGVTGTFFIWLGTVDAGLRLNPPSAKMAVDAAKERRADGKTPGAPLRPNTGTDTDTEESD